MSKQELRSTNSRKYLQFWNKIEITLNALFLVYLTHFLLLFVWFEKYVDVRFCFDRHHSPTVQLEAHRATTKVITLVSHKAHRINTRSKLCSWRECEWLPIGLVLLLIGWQSGAGFWSQSLSVAMQNRLLFYTQLKTAVRFLSCNLEQISGLCNFLYSLLANKSFLLFP